MKLLIGTIVLGAAGVAFGQDAQAVPAAPVAPRAAIMPVIATDGVIIGVSKNNPFTADESGETVKIMPDGNRVTQKWAGTIARNSEGRIARDITSGQVGDGSSRPMILGSGRISAMPVAIGTGDGQSRVYIERSAVEGAAAGKFIVSTNGTAPTIITSSDAPATVIAPAAVASEEGVVTLRAQALSKELAARAAGGGDVVAIRTPGTNLDLEGKFTTRKENLGTRDFGGVQAEGTRTVVTFAAGAIGNDRELEITSETWFAKDLGVVVYSKRNDPRVGETTYQMTNIVRAEPDASRFGHE